MGNTCRSPFVIDISRSASNSTPMPSSFTRKLNSGSILLKKWFSKERPIEVIVRHCYYSEVSAHKARPKGFDRKKCFLNLLETTSNERGVNITCLLDNSRKDNRPHFLEQQTDVPVIPFSGGSECASFLFMLDYVLATKQNEEAIIYFLEDDYLHKPGWVKIMREGFSIPQIDYITLYDHRDKYEHCNYSDLRSQLFYTPSCHWRTTPSTTNTYAMLGKTLARDEAIHRQFSSAGTISQDHAKFCALEQEGKKLISCLPGFSSHLEPDYTSPCTNWEEILECLPK